VTAHAHRALARFVPECDDGAVDRRDERWAVDNFAQRYRLPTGGVVAEIENRVIGSAWGANGYTTRAQADDLGRRLRLAPGVRLCDLGAGRGWPGLYLAQQFGCDVVLTDLPFEGIAIAAETARKRGLDRLAAGVVSSARALPFRPKSFDALVHTDVLC